MINRRQLLHTGSLGLGVLLSGCMTGRGISDEPSQRIALETLIRQMKYDVGTWLWRHQKEKEALNPPPPGAPPEDVALYQEFLKTGRYRAAQRGEFCVGQVSMKLVQVKLTATTVVNQETLGSGGLELPIGLATFSPSGKVSEKDVQTVTTSVNIFPTAADREEDEYVPAEPQPRPEFVGHPITDTLEALRTAMERTADTAPCFHFGIKEQTNSIKFGFEVVRSANAGGKLKLLFFSLGAESTLTRSVANTIEVFFASKGEFG